MQSLNVDNQKSYDQFAPLYEEATRMLAPEYYGGSPKDLSMLEKVINKHFKEEFCKDSDWILELGCGTGRLTIPFLKKGYKIVSIDFSRGMVARCYEKIKGRKNIISNGKFELFNCDIRNDNKANIKKIKEGKNICIAVAPWSFLHSFSKEDQIRVLNNLSMILCKGGWLVDFDAYQILLTQKLLSRNNAETGATKMLMSKKNRVGKTRHVWVDEFYLEKDVLPSLIQDRQLLINNKKIFSEKYLMQPPHDYMNALQKAGFKTVAVLNYDIEPFTYRAEITKNSEGVIYVCRKAS